MRFPKIFAKPAETKESQTGRAMVLTPGQAVWSPRDYASFAKEGYQQNVIAFRSVKAIADAVASVKWTLWRGETEVIAHPLLDLLKKPNPTQSYSQYMRAKIGLFLIAGNGYEERVKVGGNVRELYQLRPDRMTIIPAANGMVQAFRYSANGQTVTFPVDPVTMDSDVRHIKSFNPLNDFYGQSAIEAGAYAVDQNNLAMAWMQALLQNSARPSGAMVNKADTALSDDQFHRLKSEIEGNYSGAKNAGRPMLLEGGLEWVQMGLTPVDMGVVETKNSAARDIALAFGVPPQLLGIPGDNTYSNYAEARLAFWEDTVIPLLDLIADDWSDWLGGPFGLTFKPDLDQIPAIVEKRRALWTMADASHDLTIDERRALKGYQPLPNGEGAVLQDVPADTTGPITAGLKAAYGYDTKS